ncbi:MarC family protein [Candidatus Woesearchaeota archaeon]|nr:MarC family protein [Candidatus Woesearchaeota archaeon]
MELHILLAFFIASFSALFTIINPFSTASVFLSITKGDKEHKRDQMAKKACMTAATVLIVFALIGTFILQFFSITVEAFRIAGGIIVSIVGIRMVYAKRTILHTEKERKESLEKEDVSVIPLAIPMLSGPGAMTTVIVLMSESPNYINKGIVLVAILIVCLLSYIVLSKASIIDKYLGETRRRVIDRIMGLIVLVVGVQFVINGVEGLVLGWMGI